MLDVLRVFEKVTNGDGLETPESKAFVTAYLVGVFYAGGGFVALFCLFCYCTHPKMLFSATIQRF